MNPSGPPATVDAARHARRSVGAFLPPGGTGRRPWRVHVPIAAALRTLSDALVEAPHAGRAEDDPDNLSCPRKCVEPTLSRRRNVGHDLHRPLGIEPGQPGRMLDQHARNSRFFDAPRTGSWLDAGTFLPSIMLAAAGGLATSPRPPSPRTTAPSAASCPSARARSSPAASPWATPTRPRPRTCEPIASAWGGFATFHTIPDPHP